jgi:hypothetical protein
MSEDDFITRSPPAIYTIRGQSAVMDEDVATLFGVETRRLNEQVRRNAARFGEDFAFQLDPGEYADLMSQIATSSTHGGRRKPPMMFTEHGVVMAATVLRSERAVAASRFIVRAFVASRQALVARHAGQNLPASPLPISIEARQGLMVKLDRALGRVLDAIVEPEGKTTVRDEARAVALEGLGAIKAHLRKQGVQNEQTLAEIQKLLKEAEAIDAEITARHVETDHRRLALVAKELRIAIEVQRYLETGSAEGLLAVLKELGNG